MGTAEDVQEPATEYFEIYVSEDPDDYEAIEGEEITDRVLNSPRRDDLDILRLIIRSRWKFHKTDLDPWPSALHGHHSSLPLKLDAITGNVFDVRTKKCTERLKRKELDRIQFVLLTSKDFAEKAASLLKQRR